MWDISQNTERETTMSVKIVKDPKSSHDALHALAESDDLDVIVALAKNPSTPVTALRFLNRKWYDFPRSPRFLWGTFIHNPNCPRDILVEIERDTTNPWTKETARAHPNFQKKNARTNANRKKDTSYDTR